MNKELNSSSFFLPSEETLEIQKAKKSLSIGVPKEQDSAERRVPLIPEGVDLLVKNGFEILIETGAGVSAGYTDNDYSEVGAQIIYSSKEIFSTQVVLKMNPPTIEEIEMMSVGALLISALPLQLVNGAYFKALQRKKITAIAFELLKDNHDTFAVVRSMSEIAGNSVIQLASYYLGSAPNAKGKLLGAVVGIPPSEVVILGSGTVAEYATRSALGLGASVKVFDSNIQRLRRFQNLFQQRVYTALIKPKELEKALLNADVVIGAIRGTTGRCPMVIFDHHVQQMKDGAILIDVSIDRGGCSETSEVTTLENPTYKKYGVTHYCVPNIASSVPYTASYALSNIFAPILLEIGEQGGIQNTIYGNINLRNSLYALKGKTTNEFISKTFDLPYTNLSIFFPKF
ncbi:MAG: alanine dehydrogenase [Flavobacteriales bacterium]|jgi:alanine dehydrogenase|nr:alanine dehydrogenase [Flavobacteriales bacterium]